MFALLPGLLGGLEAEFLPNPRILVGYFTCKHALCLPLKLVFFLIDLAALGPSLSIQDIVP